MDQVFHTDDVEFAKSFLDDFVGSDRGPVSSNLNKSPLVYKFTNRLEVGSSPGDIRLSAEGYNTVAGDGLWSDRE